MVPGQDSGYAFHECLMDYGGIPQKWVLVSSEKGRQRQEKTYERNVKNAVLAGLFWQRTTWILMPVLS